MDLGVGVGGRFIALTIANVNIAVRRRNLVLVFSVFFLLLPSVLTHLALWQIERRLGLEISRKPLFVFQLGRVKLEDPFIQWQEYLTLHSGDLEARYDLFGFLGGEVPISVDGVALAVTFSDRLAKTLGETDAVFEALSLRATISRDGGFVIKSLNAQSKRLQFQINERYSESEQT
jgi:hypothetical protein